MTDREILDGAYDDYLVAYDRELDDREPLSRKEWERVYGADILREAKAKS